MGEEYFCPTCGGSFRESGKCTQCGSSLETNGDAEGDNGDIIDDELLKGRTHGREMGY